ncbi:fimbrial protein [Salmonella enterica]|nr:fimbrial protein [Salmonella enterica subsp. enterica serovar Javiana]EEP0859178.1 fimbrial protein [Salmonella enterica]EGH8262059.1 fimbrial protein [Salmonella enterica]EGL2916296.1 fimbrial protein [Salmonella enterica]EJP9495735.1 fimbrial protein [Salmonella enterica]
MKKLLLIAMVLSVPGYADNMAFHGTLVEPPCTINEGKVIEVAFGTELGISKIDGNNYRQTIDYSIKCDNGYAPNNLALVVDTSRPTTYDSSAIATDKTGLGIRILLDGQGIEFARRVPVDPFSPPVLEAVPVQEPGVVLEEGAFSATMTLRTDYL